MRESKRDEYVSWVTDEGYIYIARIDGTTITLWGFKRGSRAAGRLRCSRPIFPPMENVCRDFGVIFFGSNDGFVAAIREDGVLFWQYATGEPIVQAPAAIGDHVYFSTQHGGLYCVDAKPDESGQAVEHWYAPGALQFLAASKMRVTRPTAAATR